MTRPPPALPSPVPAARWGARLPRALAALGVVAAVLLLHGALLARWPGYPGPGRVAGAAPVLQVRQLKAAQPQPAALAAPERDATAARAPEPGPAATPQAAPTVATPAVVAGEVAPDASAPATLPPGGGAALPRYATRLPPPVTLQYTLQRDGPGPGRSGLQAELRWRPADGRYSLTMGFGATGWASVGLLDADGVAPERHVETRRGRELRAASFRREAGPSGGRITFSGPPVEHALLPGAQDRLSWMLQLAAVLEADPALGQPGREVQLFVVGVRGDAAVWTFKVMARGAAELPAGTVADAVYLQREPQRPYDTRADVWLDAARHHLPVRLRLNNRSDGDGTDFLLTHFSLP